MNTNIANWNQVIYITKTVAISIFALLIAMRSEAVEIESPLKIFTFAGVQTETAMRASDYARVIEGYRRFGANFSFHDLVNLCAAHIYQKQYVEASNACSRAETFRATRDLAISYHGPGAWVAYANGAAAHALNGDFESAREKIFDAQRRGGDTAIVERNLIAIENMANRGAQVSMNE